MTLIVSLSAIPPRFGALDATLNSILRQDRRPDRIELQIPHSYRRFPDWDGGLPQVPDGVTICRCDTDYGPASKLLPALQRHAGQPVDILFCDDDRIYYRKWSARFMAARQAQPQAAIAEAGHILPDIAPNARPAGHLPLAVPRRKDLSYRAIRVASLGLYRPRAWARSGYVDILKGYNGALVRPDFFAASVFDIPNILWSVDDYWLSGQLALNGVGIWLNSDGIISTERAIARRDALLDFATDDHGRGAANRACVEWFRTNHGIW